ncbi:hypothetical protein EVAR_29526_1 [Eumeta japonica]|uniref:Uncharacterized protein n=1 Tax=Eumeta variegata TaxID=151549 RepID=A0A4C1WFP7_EUMVA|nr:hypothetical protein EVAR_29526_1 [Eumeta japonica]
MFGSPPLRMRLGGRCYRILLSGGRVSAARQPELCSADVSIKILYPGVVAPRRGVRPPPLKILTSCRDGRKMIDDSFNVTQTDKSVALGRVSGVAPNTIWNG